MFIDYIIIRVEKFCDQRVLPKQQFGFRKGRACRNAVFLLKREVERRGKQKKPLISVFVDFKKAFDSVSFKELYRVLELQGCPAKILNLVKKLYDGAKVNIECTGGEETAQSKGVRQGCSLSPLLFSLALAFSSEVFEKATESLGFKVWYAYADDIVLLAENPKEAEVACREMEAAAALLGLNINYKKTEVLAMNVAPPVVEEGDAKWNKVEVATQKKGEWRKGWMADWAARNKISKNMEIPTAQFETQANKLKTPTHLLVWDEPNGGERAEAVIWRQGWVETVIGKRRVKTLGQEEYVDEKKNKHRCHVCGSVLDNAHSLKFHQATGFCNPDRTQAQQRRLHTARKIERRNRGEEQVKLEEVKVCGCLGAAFKSVGVFKYLGTQITAGGGFRKN